MNGSKEFPAILTVFLLGSRLSASANKFTTKVKNKRIELAFAFLIKPVGNRGSSRLINNAQDVQPGNSTSILGFLTLCIIEVGGDCDDRILDADTQIGLGDRLHLLKNHGGDLGRIELLGAVLGLHLNLGLSLAVIEDAEREVGHVFLKLGIAEGAPNHTLGIKYGGTRISGSRGFRGVANQSLSVRKSNHGRDCTCAGVRGDDLNAIILPDSNAGEGGSKINTNNRTLLC